MQQKDRWRRIHMGIEHQHPARVAGHFHKAGCRDHDLDPLWRGRASTHSLQSSQQQCKRQGSRADAGLIEDFIVAAKNPINEIRLMGMISVAHVAIGCLYQTGTTPALGAATELLATWPEPDRSDLVWYLRSEGHSPV